MMRAQMPIARLNGAKTIGQIKISCGPNHSATKNNVDIQNTAKEMVHVTAHNLTAGDVGFAKTGLPWFAKICEMLEFWGMGQAFLNDMIKQKKLRWVAKGNAHFQDISSRSTLCFIACAE
jgi:hypothetical protein